MRKHFVHGIPDILTRDFLIDDSPFGTFPKIFLTATHPLNMDSPNRLQGFTTSNVLKVLSSALAKRRTPMRQNIDGRLICATHIHKWTALIHSHYFET
jgi:hypothetical protein